MKKCNYCNNEFTETTTRGTEQKYCSIKCRTNAANKRHQENLINKVKQDYEQSIRQPIGEIVSTSDNTNTNGSDYQDKRKTDFFNATGDVGNSNVLRLLERNYETKAACLSYELKYEQLLKENEELKRKVIELELELEELEQEPEETGMIGSVMEQFKQDPVNTISFATQLIQNLFKPNNNEIAEKK